MAAAYPEPSKHSKHSAVYAQVQKIKEEIDTLITKMQKDTTFSPTHAHLEQYAEQIIDFISENPTIVSQHNRYLKAAIIDLTEVPEMAPQMQRISFLTSLHDASKNIHEFMNCQ